MGKKVRGRIKHVFASQCCEAWSAAQGTRLKGGNKATTDACAVRFGAFLDDMDVRSQIHLLPRLEHGLCARARVRLSLERGCCASESRVHRCQPGCPVLRPGKRDAPASGELAHR